MDSWTKLDMVFSVQAFIVLGGFLTSAAVLWLVLWLEQRQSRKVPPRTVLPPVMDDDVKELDRTFPVPEVRPDDTASNVIFFGPKHILRKRALGDPPPTVDVRKIPRGKHIRPVTNKDKDDGPGAA